MSWDEFLGIVDETIQQVITEKTQPPRACPNDGEPLQDGPDGSKFCRFDGWQYPRDDWRSR